MCAISSLKVHVRYLISWWVLVVFAIYYTSLICGAVHSIDLESLHLFATCFFNVQLSHPCIITQTSSAVSSCFQPYLILIENSYLGIEYPQQPSSWWRYALMARIQHPQRHYRRQETRRCLLNHTQLHLPQPRPLSTLRLMTHNQSMLWPTNDNRQQRAQRWQTARRNYDLEICIKVDMY